MESDSERKKRAVVVVVRSEDKVNPATFEWQWGGDELSMVDQYSYLGIEISKDCSFAAHRAKAIGKGKAHTYGLAP